MFGPVITVIDAGHFPRTGETHPLNGKCGVCETTWPCLVMDGAVRDQRVYAVEVAVNEAHRKALVR